MIVYEISLPKEYDGFTLKVPVEHDRVASEVVKQELKEYFLDWKRYEDSSWEAFASHIKKDLGAQIKIVHGETHEIANRILDHLSETTSE